jgi:transcriptional regulator GlxA family with amidase domain
VDNGARLTSGGAAPAIDMMLHLIAQRHGVALADRIAGILIYDASATPTRPQNRQSPRARHSAITARAQALMEAALDEPVPVEALARHLGLGVRALQQQFRARLGTTPQAHYLDLRLGEADRLVTQTGRSLLDVALATGFTSQASFARAYRRRFGTSARDRRRAAQ